MAKQLIVAKEASGGTKTEDRVVPLTLPKPTGNHKVGCC